MSHHSTQERSQNKRTFSRSNDARSSFAEGSRPKRSWGNRSSAPHGFARRRQNQGGRRVKTFNPSDFIKKVEEQVTAPAYVAQNNFSDFLLTDIVKENIIKRGYKTPTPIQDQAIPHLLEGKDLIGSANTGTGKTAAFLIPLVNNLFSKKIKRALIIAPTRELAAQIQDELKFFKEKTGLTTVLCIGGASINFQVSHLRRHPDFVIGTPGRLKDLEQQRAINFGHFDAIVLDEVDTMLDMGFINDMKYIISKLPERRQSIFFSATISKSIKSVMDEFLKNPVSVSVKTRQSSENVNQDIIKVTGDNKVDVLHNLLIKPDFSKVIVFAKTKRATDKLSRSLRERGFTVSSIHGDKTQSQRKNALAQFKDNRVKILLATDVVARGIDIDDVSHVINYDLPQTHDDYIHRIGRTGRANKIGQAITFIEQPNS